LAFVRTVTPPIVAVFRPSAVAAAAPEADPLPAAALPVADALLPAAALLVAGALVAGALLAGALLGALLEELLDELHAARAARAAAKAGTTSSARRRRLGIFSLSCDVIMSFPPFLVSYQPFSLRCGEPCPVRNDADESALHSTVRVAWGRPARRERRSLRGADRYARGCAGVPGYR
jgi:hypothetical protein